MPATSGAEKDALEAEVRERYAGWDNPIWIGFAIDNFSTRS